jgi:hypothetical protein
MVSRARPCQGTHTVSATTRASAVLTERPAQRCGQCRCVFVAARHFALTGEKGGHAGAGRNGEQPLEEEAAAPVRARSIPAHPAHRAKCIGSVERLDGRVILYMGRLF